MSDKAIYSVDTVETITDNDKIYVNTGDNIKQIKSSDLFIDINSNLIEQKMLGWTVPSECPIQNEVSGNQFIQKVGRVDLGNLDWSIINGCFYSGKNIFKQYEIDVMPNIFTRKYTTITTRWVSTYNKSVDKVVSLQPAETNQLWFYDSAYTTINTFKKSLLGQYLYYELPTPITMTIDGNEVTERINESLVESSDYLVPKKLNDSSSVINGYVDMGKFYLASSFGTVCVPCEKGKTYVITKKQGERFIVGTCNTIPTTGTIINNVIINNTATELKVKNTDDNYVIAFVYNASVDTLSRDEIINSVVIKELRYSNVNLTEYVDSLKNDLIVLEATSTIDMTASRELDDIASSALTIPSGYKPIAMYGYNSDNNDNISAVPLLIKSDGKVLYHAKNHSTSDQGIIHFVIRVTLKKLS